MLSGSGFLNVLSVFLWTDVLWDGQPARNVPRNAAHRKSTEQVGAWAIDPVPLSPALLTQLTDMDGAVLVDKLGQCHAIGVILDGQARGKGEPSRGSRFNNAIRYLDSDPPASIVVVYRQMAASIFFRGFTHVSIVGGSSSL